MLQRGVYNLKYDTVIPTAYLDANFGRWAGGGGGVPEQFDHKEFPAVMCLRSVIHSLALKSPDAAHALFALSLRVLWNDTFQRLLQGFRIVWVSKPL